MDSSESFAAIRGPGRCVRAMILAAGLGTRLRPLTEYRAKPALPIRGRPVISLLLEFLSRHGVEEVMINLHYLPQTVRDAVEMDCPERVNVHWSEESQPLGTGGGIRGAASFLGESEHCVVLAGDMLLDLDLERIVENHIASARDVSLVLRSDSRWADFGTIGVDAEGNMMRVGDRSIGASDSSPEYRSGVFTGLRVFSRSVFTHWPTDFVFEDLRDWLVPNLAAGEVRLGVEFVDESDSVWEPVGTPEEYLNANLSPPRLPSLGGGSERWSGEVEIVGRNSDVILGSESRLGESVDLERVVVWPGEEVPSGSVASDGVYAGGRFHACRGVLASIDGICGDASRANESASFKAGNPERER